MTIGCEQLQKIKVTINDQDNYKEIEFKLPANLIVRMNIEGTGGFSGTLIDMNYKLQIITPDVKVKYKPTYFPYSKYIILNRHRNFE